jgi:hypothetical protein
MSTAAAAAAILCSYSGMIGGSVRFPSLSRRSLRGSFLVLLLRLLLLLPLLLPLLLLLLLLLLAAVALPLPPLVLSPIAVSLLFGFVVG